MSTHWGEIPIIQDTDSGIAALEREQMTKPRPMDVEGPPLHQPSGGDIPQVLQVHPAEAFSIDSLTLHTIKLIQYARKVRSMIQTVHQQLETLKSGEGEEKELPIFPEAPPIPEYVGSEIKHKPLEPIPYLVKDVDSPFCTGLGEAPPEVDTRTCRKLLHRSVAAICSHAGYDNCGELILETLTDVSHEYMLQMTRLLRRAVDNEAINGGTGFPDVMEQVFHEMGIGSPLVLHDFYQNRVVKYHANMERTCHSLRHDYSRIRNPEIKVIEDIKPIIKTKEEGTSDIQFPTLEEEDTSDADQVIHLEGLGLDINIVNEPSGSLNTEDEGGKWGQGSTKSDTADNFVVPTKPRRKCLSTLSLIRKRIMRKIRAKKAREGSVSHQILLMEPSLIGQHRSSLDAYDHDGTPAPGHVPATPGLDSEGPDSIQDPASISDIMSPPSIGIRTGKPPPLKKRKK